MSAGMSVSAQDLFDTIVTHLKTQGRQALSEDGLCLYKTSTGLKCAVGCLIEDEEYAPHLENEDAYVTLRRIPRLKPLIDNYGTMLIDLQAFHDNPHNWLPHGMSAQGVGRLREIARLYRLNMRAIT